jgi:hypothetical protein
MNEEEEFDFEKYRKSKEYKESVRKLNYNLYFNNKYRQELKKDFVELESSSLKNLKQLKKFNQSDIQTRKTTLLWEGLLDLAGVMRESYERAEQYNRDKILKNAKFVLYAKKSAKKLIFKNTYYKVSEEKNKTAYFVVGGKDKKGRTKGGVIRKRISLKGYPEIDRGRFWQKVTDFRELRFTFRGKKTYKYKCTARAKDGDKLWVEVIK